MKRVASILLSMALMLSLISSCGETKKESTSKDDKSSKTETSINKDDFTGIWVTAGGKAWMEFYDNGTLDLARKGKKEVTGIPYKLNTEEGTLELKRKKGVTMFSYKMVDNALLLTDTKKNKTIRYNKTKARPVL